MGLMEMLRQGGGRRDEYEDFVRRFEDGDPTEGYDEDEARRRYDEVTGELSDDDYEVSAREAFERLSPQQRRELGRMLRQEGRNRNVTLDDDDGDDERYEDAARLARMSRKARSQQSDGLGGLLGGSGSGGGMLSNPLAKAALAGVAAMAAKRMFGR